MSKQNATGGEYTVNQGNSFYNLHTGDILLSLVLVSVIGTQGIH
jgi:hypothetical protein